MLIFNNSLTNSKWNTLKIIDTLVAENEKPISRLVAISSRSVSADLIDLPPLN